jgi:glutamate dehydrogenase/leucine dehydrogenase
MLVEQVSLRAPTTATARRVLRTLPRVVAAAASYASKAPADIRVLVVGPTGYIGKFVVKELIKRGYNVVAFAREQAGIKGKMTKADTIKVPSPARCSLLSVHGTLARIPHTLPQHQCPQGTGCQVCVALRCCT